MHCTLPPLLGRVEKSLFAFLVAGKAALDLSPVYGATMVACVEMAPVAMVDEGSEAILLFGFVTI